MKWNSLKTWPKGLKVLSVVLVAVIILLSAFGAQSKNAETQSNNREEGKYKSYDAASSQAPAPAAEPAATYEGEASYGGSMSKAENAAMDITFSETMTTVPVDRKIIKDGNTRIETKEFDRSLQAIDQMIAQSGGFAEVRNISGNSMNASKLRFANIVFRVPAKDFEMFMQQMNTVGTVVSSNTSGTDITDQYIDLETRVKNLKIQEQTLQEIMAKAEKIEDVITLESRMSQLRYEIESIENQLKNFERLVQYSRISVDLMEVVEVTQQKPVARTLGQRISETFNEAIEDFTNGLEDFALWLVGKWITLIFILVIIVLCWIMIKRKARKSKLAKKEALTAVDNDNQ